MWSIMKRGELVGDSACMILQIMGIVSTQGPLVVFFASNLSR